MSIIRKKLKDLKDYRSLKEKNLSERVLKLLKVLVGEVKDHQDPQIIVFVTSKLTAAYLNQLIEDLKN